MVSPSPTVQSLIGCTEMFQTDGGQWDMVVNLIEKYGLVPQALFPETWNSSNSGKLNSLLTSKVDDRFFKGLCQRSDAGFLGLASRILLGTSLPLPSKPESVERDYNKDRF